MTTIRKRIGLELWRHLQDNLIKEHPLRQLFWETTLRCNLHCRHCGSDCRTVSGTPDMPREDFMRVLDSIARRTDPHQVFVILTGGEPLLRPDIVECGREIYSRGFPWGMVTNGLMLTSEKLKALIGAGLHALTVSLDGLEENHNWMRGHAESFSRVSRALDLMRAEPTLAYDVVTCANARNIDELPALRDFLISKGVRSWRLFTVFPVGRAASDPAMRLTGDQFRQVMEFIKDTRKQGTIKASYGCEGFLGDYEAEARDRFYSCQAGITVGSVLCDGSISACPSIRPDFHQGSIYQDDFMDVWAERFARYRHREWMRTGPCADCSAFRYCRGNGMHLRDADGHLLMCHWRKLRNLPMDPVTAAD
ncbi:MAG: TIGR04133 family radical SAM/SPASM protein [Prevotella sp.]|nr:TIGR04133 family radical SAM/SPASM protein [Prevotella sp.]